MCSSDQAMWSHDRTNECCCAGFTLTAPEHAFGGITSLDTTSTGSTRNTSTAVPQQYLHQAVIEDGGAEALGGQVVAF